MYDDVCKAYVTRIPAWFVALNGCCVPKVRKSRTLRRWWSSRRVRCILQGKSKIYHLEDAT